MIHATHSPSRRRVRALRAWLSSWTVAFLFFACYSEPESTVPARPGSSGGAASAGSGGAAGATGVTGGAGTGASESVCGDGVLADDEQCDDRNEESGDGCSAECEIEESIEGACGDAEPSGHEECDDGNLQPGDGCDATCGLEECGNERVEAGEECDPPLAGECSANCSIVRPRCGDGVLQEADQEECDDENDQPEDGCFECRKECGDGRIDREAGEACDPVQSSACSDECEWLPVCGDGIVQRELGEECDPSRGDCVNCKRVELPPPPPPACEGGAGGGSFAGGAGGEGQCEPDRCVKSPAAELVQNGNFENATTGWSPHGLGVQVRTSSEAPEPPALEVSLASSSVRSVSGAAQCIPIRAGARYQFQGQYRIPPDAPGGVSASVMAFLYPGNLCQGEFVRPATSGPAGSVRDVWTPYQFNIDTSGLSNLSPSGEGRLLLRLGLVAPAEVQGARVLWDGASLVGRCGNCEVEAGESCDDGNTESGDGCAASCGLEICGDGVQSQAEQCDDGNALFGGEGDECTASCRTPSECDLCARPRCSSEMVACLGLEGTAHAGPAAGTARSTLCDRLRTCVQETACHKSLRKSGSTDEAYFDNCYCGSTGFDCFEGQANGSCRAEVEAALETTDPLAIAQRFGGSDARYPVTAALAALLRCEGLSGEACSGKCQPSQVCGDGLVQDRVKPSEFRVVVDGEPAVCGNVFTPTDRRCSFEECDDKNTQTRDGCDEQCFLEICGNRLIQADEECDDGNAESGDGCSAECQLEFECGNSVVEEPFEHCDPPDATGTKVCTQAEFEKNPAQCACGSDCRRAVCGDGRVQRPAEKCDPPEPGVCTDECQFEQQSPCQECIAADPELGPYYLEACTTAECIDVLRCETQAECSYPNPTDCYCGSGASPDACEQPAFVPDGPCVDVIVAGSLSPGEAETLDNVNVTITQERWFDTTRPAAIAHEIMNVIMGTAGHPCRDECFPSATFP